MNFETSPIDFAKENSSPGATSTPFILEVAKFILKTLFGIDPTKVDLPLPISSTIPRSFASSVVVSGFKIFIGISIAKIFDSRLSISCLIFFLISCFKESISRVCPSVDF